MRLVRHILSALKNIDLWLGMKIFGTGGLDGEVGFSGDLDAVLIRDDKIVAKVSA